MEVKLDLSGTRAPELIRKIVEKHKVFTLDQVCLLSCYLDNVFCIDGGEILPIKTDKFFEIRLYKSSTIGRSSIWAVPVDLDEGPEFMYDVDASVDDECIQSDVSLLLKEYVATHPECGIDLKKF